MQVLRFRVKLESDWTDSRWRVDCVRKICCILCCSSWLLRGAGLTVVLILFLLFGLQYLRHPETLLEEVDQGLAQVLLRPITVKEMALVWVDLWINTEMNPFIIVLNIEKSGHHNFAATDQQVCLQTLVTGPYVH